MSKWLVSSLGLALVAACGGGTGPHDLNDALPASDASSVCNVLTQTGCPADEPRQPHFCGYCAWHSG